MLPTDSRFIAKFVFWTTLGGNRLVDLDAATTCSSCAFFVFFLLASIPLQSPRASAPVTPRARGRPRSGTRRGSRARGKATAEKRPRNARAGAALRERKMALQQLEKDPSSLTRAHLRAFRAAWPGRWLWSAGHGARAPQPSSPRSFSDSAAAVKACKEGLARMTSSLERNGLVARSQPGFAAARLRPRASERSATHFRPRERRPLVGPVRVRPCAAPCRAAAASAPLRTPLRHVSFAPPLHRHEVTVSVPGVCPEALWLLWNLPRRVASYVPELEALGLRRGALGSTLMDVRLAYAFAETQILPTLEIWSRWRCVRIVRDNGRGTEGGGGGRAAVAFESGAGTAESAATGLEDADAKNESADTRDGVREGKRKKGKKKKRNTQEEVDGVCDATGLISVDKLPRGSFAMAFEPVAGAPLSLAVIAVPNTLPGRAAASSLFVGERTTLAPEEATQIVEQAVEWRGAAWEAREARRARDRRRNEERRASRNLERTDEGGQAAGSPRKGEAEQGVDASVDEALPIAASKVGRSSASHPNEPLCDPSGSTVHSSLLTLRLSYFVPKHLAEVVGAAALYADVDGRLEEAAWRCRDEAVQAWHDAEGGWLDALRKEKDSWRQEAAHAMQTGGGAC